jgi:DNA-binding YbaB/EbfC family protein
MFDKLKDIGKLAHLATRAQQLQQQMKSMQEQLSSERITGDAGGGRVTATVNGRLELIAVRIDPERIDITNIELLQELITAAVRSAQYQATAIVQQKMEQVAADAGISRDMLPGGDI